MRRHRLRPNVVQFGNHGLYRHESVTGLHLSHRGRLCQGPSVAGTEATESVAQMLKAARQGEEPDAVSLLSPWPGFLANLEN